MWWIEAKQKIGKLSGVAIKLQDMLRGRKPKTKSLWIICISVKDEFVWEPTDALLTYLSAILGAVNHQNPMYGLLPKSIKTVMSRFDRVDDDII